MQARSLTVSPNILRPEMITQTDLALRLAAEQTDPEEVADYVTIDEGLDYVRMDAEERQEFLDEKVDERLEFTSERIPEIIESHGKDVSNIRSEEILEKFYADSHYEVLVRNVDPDIASEITDELFGIAGDHQDIRQYPNGAVAENIIGRISMDGEGQFGFEAPMIPSSPASMVVPPWMSPSRANPFQVPCVIRSRLLMVPVWN